MSNTPPKRILDYLTETREERVTALLHANNEAIERLRALRRLAEGLSATIKAQGETMARLHHAVEEAQRKALEAEALATRMIDARVEAERQRDGARAMLREAADQFAAYADAHAAKGTPEAAAKAEVNRDWSARCRAVAGALPAAEPK